ncbi:effector-associated constant component EACC1 [Yinghuangia soli]|uniref:Uncharacterized protein n=1 Tax=Yinghuangia soli TaxID=2908204 RepID=A0AA41Q0Y8_9ACTN|nr:hypothetical protein [Yinghuangia soli]MCF2528042.1 hypothetical protein [Yinghuangia soli]
MDAFVVSVVAAADEEADELEQLARLLQDDLLEEDVESAEPLSEESAPDLSKGLGVVAGSLAVRIAATTALRALVARIRKWAARTERSVEITIDGDTLKLTGATEEQQEQLINVWLARHGSGA